MFGNEPDETIPQEQNPNYDNRPYDFNAPRDVNYQGLTSVQEDAVRRFGDLYGQGPEQNFALQGMQNVFGTIPRAQYDTETQASQLRRLGDRYLQGYMDRPSYTMATLERDYPDMYRRPDDETDWVSFFWIVLWLFIFFFHKPLFNFFVDIFRNLLYN